MPRVLAGSAVRDRGQGDVESSAPTHGDATLGDIVADSGTFSVVRQQTARNLRTGKVRSTGPTQRLEGTLSRLFGIEADWEAFIERYGDENESPAPRRPPRSGVWSDTGQTSWPCSDRRAQAPLHHDDAEAHPRQRADFRRARRRPGPAGANADATATLTWSLPRPEIGWIDAGDDECNASFHQSVPFERRVVPAIGHLFGYSERSEGVLFAA